MITIEQYEHLHYCRKNEPDVLWLVYPNNEEHEEHEEHEENVEEENENHE